MVTFDSPPFKGKLATVVATGCTGRATVVLDDMEGEYLFDPEEFERVEGGAA
jgi:hypothetical protein